MQLRCPNDRFAQVYTDARQAIVSREVRIVAKKPKRQLVVTLRGNRIDRVFAAVHESAYGKKRTSLVAPHMSAFGGKADIGRPLLI
jgi:hypothetical protein